MIKEKKAQTMLSLVFLISGVMIAIGVAVAIIAVSFINSVYAYRSASLVEAMAESGINDAVLRLERNNSYTGQFVINFSNGSVTVTVSSGPLTNQDTVTAFSQLASAQQKITAILAIDPTTKVVSVVSWQKQNF
jgi:ABC-type lipoprotein release transport system permease subunit